MSPPTHFDVTYQINPWMRELGSVKRKRAADQWHYLYQQIQTHATVIATAPRMQPDFVFTANAGLVHGREVILSSFKCAERQQEEPYWKQLFQEHGYTIHNLHTVAFEGAGDALFAGDVLIGGHGVRTDLAAYEQINTIWDIPILPVELIDKRFYHLDTCLCVLDAHTIMYYPAAFSEVAREQLETRFTTIIVDEEEALRFACNAVVIHNHVILPADTPQTQTKLTHLGYTVSEVPMDEFLKSGGAAKCLTLIV